MLGVFLSKPGFFRRGVIKTDLDGVLDVRSTGGGRENPSR